MEVIIRPDADAATTLVSALISKAVSAKPDLVLGLATGRTMEGVYDKLAEPVNVTCSTSRNAQPSTWTNISACHPDTRTPTERT